MYLLKTIFMISIVILTMGGFVKKTSGRQERESGASAEGT